jgi:hypothetical protein
MRCDRYIEMRFLQVKVVAMWRHRQAVSGGDRTGMRWSRAPRFTSCCVWSIWDANLTWRLATAARRRRTTEQAMLHEPQTVHGHLPQPPAAWSLLSIGYLSKDSTTYLDDFSKLTLDYVSWYSTSYTLKYSLCRYASSKYEDAVVWVCRVSEFFITLLLQCSTCFPFRRLVKILEPAIYTSFNFKSGLLINHDLSEFSTEQIQVSSDDISTPQYLHTT